MKRDMELVRNILQEAEALNYEDGEPPERYRAGTPEKAYQIALMRDAGLVEADVDTTNGIPSEATIARLTWAGHDFLNSSRDNKILEYGKGACYQARGLVDVFATLGVVETGGSSAGFWSGLVRQVMSRRAYHTPLPNRCPRPPLGAFCEFVYLFCAPPASSAAVGEAQRWL